MSIAAFCLRTATIMALRGATFAADRVYDSAIDPLDQRIPEKGAPIAIVTTDDETANVVGRELAMSDRSVDLIIELAIASRVAVPIEPGGQPEDEVIIPQTDAGLEFALNLMVRQVLRVFAAAGEGWAGQLRAFSGQITKLQSRRGVGAAKGVKFAARQLVFTVEPPWEPAFGVAPAPDTLYGAFLAAMRGDPDMAPHAAMLEQQILGEALPDWRRAQALLGLSEAGIRGIGLGPVDLTWAGEAPPITDIVLP